MIEIIVYKTKSGKAPFFDWQEELNISVRAAVRARLARLYVGNFGDSKIIKGGEGIWELRFDIGPGYRIYFGKKRNVLVVLLVGGDKGSQVRDIARAKRYWLEYKELNDE